MSKREFQTEVNQLLQLIIHSLYSHPEIFLREIVSNSSDALDKLRHLTLVEEAYKALPFDPRIDLELDEENQTLTIADTGIGMNEEDLVSHLGTIARSGTKTFLAQLSGDAKRDSNLIGHQIPRTSKGYDARPKIAKPSAVTIWFDRHLTA